MGRAKDIIVRPIPGAEAAALVKRVHYSGKVVQNSQLHLGVFYGGGLEGALQFGPSLDKRRMKGLVRETPMNGFLELNRMAFSDKLPRNSESRAMAVCFRMLRKHRPDVGWVVSFADATQCGDGCIYRAAGFVLTGIKRNDQIIEFPDGLRETRLVLTDARRPRRVELAKRYGVKIGGGATLKPFLDIGAKPLKGFQVRYVKFLDPAARARLTVPELPYSAIVEHGAQMYKGKRFSAGSIDSDAPGDQPGEGGANPTSALQTKADS